MFAQNKQIHIHVLRKLLLNILSDSIIINKSLVRRIITKDQSRYLELSTYSGKQEGAPVNQNVRQIPLLVIDSKGKIRCQLMAQNHKSIKWIKTIRINIAAAIIYDSKFCCV